MKDLEQRLATAVRQFWETLQLQQERQGSGAGSPDQGNRAATTGGAQMNGFASLVRGLLIEHGVPEEAIFWRRNVVLPGFYRATKDWDLLVIIDGLLIAVVEFKSQVGPSFGNNFNNRTEEAIGSATDLWTAYREGAFKLSHRPWLGYFMLLEEGLKSTRPVGVAEPHFKVFEEFRDASYARRYELLCQRLVRERLYDAACFLLSDRVLGQQGNFKETSPELSFHTFMISLVGKAATNVNLRRGSSDEA